MKTQIEIAAQEQAKADRYEALAEKKALYMNPATGAVDTLDGWHPYTPKNTVLVHVGEVFGHYVEIADRLQSWLQGTLVDVTEAELAAGLCNGDIETPDWLTVSEDINGIKIWDGEAGGSSRLGFVVLSVEG
jgi:hypothetical protein